MKTLRLLAILSAALLCTASPPSLPATEITVDISSQTPRDPDAILRQIRLNVAIRQYEKILAESYEARTQLELGPTESGLTDAQRKEWEVRGIKRVGVLREAVARLEDEITVMMRAATAAAQEREANEEKVRAAAKAKAEQSQPQG